VAIFALVARWMAGAFVRAVQEAPAAMASPRARAQRERAAFREGVAGAVIRKELLLLRRDPLLIGRALLQVVYLVPLFVVLVRRSQPSDILAAGLVMVASSLASTLGWICVSGEQAPDLLGSAPVPMQRLRALKVAAAVIPVGVVVLPFLVFYFAQSALAGGLVTAFVVLSVAGSACVQVWATPLGASRDLKARGKQDIGVRIVESFSSMGWAAACWGALSGSWWGWLGVPVGLLGPAVACVVARRRDPS
jgi:ABC-2 type transport system permease protein